ncbi:MULTISPECIES: Crp/Fnr family transcriptional regulator [Niastella]|uniref:Crp/Fnr family transcriptional regulator n=1 Tax=Niastella soli TaxID=2821487 RepID=A0ABS3YSQ0_9BACT|nr:Crp/Fnr family transcriptional regulator [Niastella soli]MBO9200818.1 Crp/Fnr family transcriptional regulator [Niastella soli]
MLRTNNAFLSFIEPLYNIQQHKEDILLKEYAGEQLLLQQGEKPAKVLLLKEGITKCYFNEEDDRKFIVEFLGRGEIMGEIEVIKDSPCLCNIKALTPVKVYAISISYFKSLLEKDLTFNKILLESFAERISNTATRASFQQLHTVEHTLGKLLELQQMQGLEISKEDMAAYLGITIRSLNRTLQKLKA